MRPSQCHLAVWHSIDKMSKQKDVPEFHLAESIVDVTLLPRNKKQENAALKEVSQHHQPINRSSERITVLKFVPNKNLVHGWHKTFYFFLKMETLIFFYSQSISFDSRSVEIGYHKRFLRFKRKLDLD